MKRLVAVGLVFVVAAVLVAMKVAGDSHDGARVVESRSVKTFLAPNGFLRGISGGAGFSGDFVTTPAGCVAMKFSGGIRIVVWPHDAKLTSNPTIVRLDGHAYRIDGSPDFYANGFRLGPKQLKSLRIDTTVCGPAEYTYLR